MLERFKQLLSRRRVKKTARKLDDAIRNLETRIEQPGQLPLHIPKEFQIKWQEHDRQMLRQMRECRRISTAILGVRPGPTPRRQTTAMPAVRRPHPITRRHIPGL